VYFTPTAEEGEPRYKLSSDTQKRGVGKTKTPFSKKLAEKGGLLHKKELRRRIGLGASPSLETLVGLLWGEMTQTGDNVGGNRLYHAI